MKTSKLNSLKTNLELLEALTLSLLLHRELTRVLTHLTLTILNDYDYVEEACPIAN